MDKWKGNWCDGSKKWTPELIRNLKVDFKNDGVFWISVVDYITLFRQTVACKVHPNYYYTSFK